MRSAFRTTYLLVASFLLTSLYKVGRINTWTWRFAARHYGGWLDRVGKWHAYLTCHLAAKNVPAYREFLAEQGHEFKLFSLSSFPETTKDNYVKKWGFLERAQNGKLLYQGTSIDESAGSSGKAFNWMRSGPELAQVHKNVAGYASLVFPMKKPFIINGYSMGAWATGTNTGIAMAKVGIVKNVGPDLEKIIDTLETFGPNFNYLITAYPPFLKHLADELDKRGFPWEQYDIAGMVGGEGMTEALRDYLERRYTKVRSGYGASDLTIGIGGESAFTVWLRKRIIHDHELREAILGDADEQRIPMIFQYSPVENYIEVNDDNELVCTVNSSAVLSPKVRYNVGDEGKILSFKEVTAILKERPDWWAEASESMKTEFMKLSVLILYGRKDSTISYMGANLYPQDIEYGLYEGNDFAERISRFCMTLVELDNLEMRPVINVELRAGHGMTDAEKETMRKVCAEGIVRHLETVSRDFAESVKEDASARDIRVVLHEYDTGPFQGRDAAIKNKYLVDAPAPAEADVTDTASDDGVEPPAPAPEASAPEAPAAVRPPSDRRATMAIRRDRVIALRREQQAEDSAQLAIGDEHQLTLE
jgi:phenylacetate-CoA ligase